MGEGGSLPPCNEKAPQNGAFDPAFELRSPGHVGTGEQGLEPQLRHPECRVLPITPFPKGGSEDSQSPTKDRLRQLLAEGLTVTEVAKRIGISKSTVVLED